MAQCVVRLICNLSVGNSNTIKGLCCFLELETSTLIAYCKKVAVEI